MESPINMKQHIKAVIWPKKPHVVDGNNVYRYIIVGMLVTNAPLLGIEGNNEVVLDCEPADLAETLEELPKRKSKIKLGDATHVLLSLEHL